MSELRIARLHSIDVTMLIDEGLPKTWRCPHCYKRNKMGQYKEDELFEFFQTMQHCERCGYVHMWELRLTDDFKQKVVERLTKGEL